MNALEFQQKLVDLTNGMKAKGLRVSGCDADEISGIEKKYGALPNLYKIFLSLVGSEAGDFKVGTDILAKDLGDINECTLELMEENGVSPPENLFAFLLHQGYSALFFVDRYADDPDVFCYTEGEAIKKTEYKFSSYIGDEIDIYAKRQ
ncbi:SMI1/KNR4 family protein [Paraburkholderia rhizosphaerae]|uniref:SMI1/KNR4 family protein SUKH-1 n=1 Tax=Paraburkholderia rhizosphaerae TaxID=480658 RepID=A0A4R8LDP4_9BURK|nr:SMI1/KNR4 family protein [Paraburkholderia rhizosphaerae]TDY40249.1 hypothetical protein BX592_1262 [Paraburkholderia rhizosphaerae]